MEVDARCHGRGEGANFVVVRCVGSLGDFFEEWEGLGDFVPCGIDLEEEAGEGEADDLGGGFGEEGEEGGGGGDRDFLAV